LLAHRLGEFERIGWLIEDWESAKEKAGPSRAADGRGVGRAGPDRPRLFHQGTVRVGAATILAETGDLHRFTSARAVVKHAGLAPRERTSDTFTGRARLTGAGRPGLRTATWAVWGGVAPDTVR